MSTGKAGDTSPGAELSEAEKEQLREELRKTEEEINTLRQVIAARMKHAADLKQKLGIGAWQEIQQDVSEGIRFVKESEAYHATNDLIQQATDALTTVGSKVSNKFGQLRSTSAFKSFEEKVGSAYSTVKEKIGGAAGNNEGQNNAQPQSPTAEGKQP
uniref:Tumor protein D52 family protein n=1 Tax=Trichuris muris TaxID=70415 RepID=A0A5S6R1Y9_TRIMR